MTPRHRTSQPMHRCRATGTTAGIHSPHGTHQPEPHDVRDASPHSEMRTGGLQTSASNQSKKAALSADGSIQGCTFTQWQSIQSSALARTVATGSAVASTAATFGAQAPDRSCGAARSSGSGGAAHPSGGTVHRREPIIDGLRNDPDDLRRAIQMQKPRGKQRVQGRLRRVRRQQRQQRWKQCDPGHPCSATPSGPGRAAAFSCAPPESVRAKQEPFITATNGS